MRRSYGKYPALIVVNPRRLLRRCTLLAAVMLGNPAFAQWSAQFDDPRGWFAGALLSEARFRDYSHDVPALALDAGYAHALASGWSWEVGATTSLFPNATSNDYTELFAGLASRRWSARVYISPDYYGRGHRTIYGEFNYFHPLDERVRLLAHLGAQHAQNVPADRHADTFDARLGIDLRLGDFSVQIQHTDTDRVSYAFPVRASTAQHRWVVSVTRPW